MRRFDKKLHMERVNKLVLERAQKLKEGEECYSLGNDIECHDIESEIAEVSEDSDRLVDDVTDVKNSQFFSDVDGERLMDIDFNA